MKQIATFHQALNKDFQGNYAYIIDIPNNTKTLSIKLTTNKDFIQDTKQYRMKYQNTLLPILKKHLEHDPSEEEYESFVKNMKAEIQLSVFTNNQFIGNVHKPGLTKEIILSKEIRSQGCLPIQEIPTQIKVIVNVFQVVEENTFFNLYIEGETYVEEN